MSDTAEHQAVALRNRIDKGIVELISNDKLEVAAYPAVVHELRAALESEYAIKDLVDIVSSDQALCATLLRRANAAEFGGVEISELSTAVSRIGAEELVRVAMAATLGASICKPSPLSELRFLCWRNGLLSAHLCELLAKNRGLVAGEAFLCGLLHDLGQVFTLSAIESIVDEDPPLEAMPAAFWTEILERFHVEVGMVMAAKWELPQLLTAVIARHHEPAPNGEGMLHLVRTVDTVVEALTRGALVDHDQLAQALPDEAERQRVLDSLEKLLTEVASLSPAADSAPHPTSLTSKERRSDDVDAKLELRIVRQAARPCEVIAIGDQTIRIRTRSATNENSLLRVELSSGPQQLEVWVNVEARSPADTEGFYELTLRLFAADEALTKLWQRLIARQSLDEISQRTDACLSVCAEQTDRVRKTRERLANEPTAATYSAAQLAKKSVVVQLARLEQQLCELISEERPSHTDQLAAAYDQVAELRSELAALDQTIESIAPHSLPQPAGARTRRRGARVEKPGSSNRIWIGVAVAAVLTAVGLAVSLAL
jgi:HD-like signal output (HDOD) protein